MANIKSAKKQARQALKKQKKNTARKSALKTAVKKVLNALVTDADIAQAQTLLREAEAKIARAKTKGLLHKKTAQRKISRLAKRVSAATRQNKK